MSLPTSLLAYIDCTELLDKALEDPRGIRYQLATYDEAWQMQTRIHYCRRLHRDENKAIYDEGHQLHGRSLYDPIVVRIRNIEGVFYVYLEQRKIRGKVENLSEINGEFTEVVKVEAPKKPELPPPPQQLVFRRV